jgi:peptidylprolyl isomerase
VFHRNEALVRRFPALVVAASVLAALTACAPGQAADGCESTVTGGSASATVDAPGDFGTAPEVSFPTPLITKSIERTELIAGEGEPLKYGQPVILEATILNGTDAAVLQQTAYAPEGGSLFTIGDTGLPALGAGLGCTTEGSRVAIVASAEDSAANDSPPATSDSIVYVVDVVRAFPARADGTAQLAVAGMPSVVTAPDGTPGITIPSEPAPTEARVELLRLGDGDEIREGDQVVAKLTAVDWDDESVVQSTWPTGSAAIVDLAGDSVSDGLKDAITGQTIGSQVLAVIPPEEGTDGATLIYVVDILGTVN